MKKYLKSFWNWLKDLTTLDESAAKLYGEAKSRAKEVKSEFKDVKKAYKLVQQKKSEMEEIEKLMKENYILEANLKKVMNMKSDV